MTGTQTATITLTRGSAHSASQVRPSSARSGATSEYGSFTYLFFFHYFCGKQLLSVAQPGSVVTTDPTAPSSPGVMSSAVPGVALLLGIIKIRKYRKGHTDRIKILSFLFYFMSLKERGKYNLTVCF